MKCNYFLSVAFLFFSYNVSVNSMKIAEEESVKDRLEKMTNTYLFGDPNSWTGVLCQKGFVACKINIETDLADIIDYECTKILQAYAMFYDCELTKQYEGHKNLLFYVVDRENIKAISVVLDYIEDDKNIINVKNDDKKTVVQEFLEKCLDHSSISEDSLTILKMLIDHKYFDRNQYITIFNTINRFTEISVMNLINNQYKLHEVLSKAQKKQCRYCPQFCAIL